MMPWKWACPCPSDFIRTSSAILRLPQPQLRLLALPLRCHLPSSELSLRRSGRARADSQPSASVGAWETLPVILPSGAAYSAWFESRVTEQRPGAATLPLELAVSLRRTDSGIPVQAASARQGIDDIGNQTVCCQGSTCGAECDASGADLSVETVMQGCGVSGGARACFRAASRRRLNCHRSRTSETFIYASLGVVSVSAAI